MKTIRSSLLRVPPMLAAPCLLLAATESNAAADVILDWNVTLAAQCASRAPDELPAAAEARIFAAMHLAMLDALRATPDGAPGADQAAAASAACAVLSAVWPEEAANFTARLEPDFRAVAGEAARERARASGAKAAGLWITDLGLAGGTPWRVRAGALDPWTRLAPLTLPRRDWFVAGDPSGDAANFAIQRFNRARAIKPLLEARAAAQWPALARYWREPSARRWNRAARELAAGAGFDVLTHARLLATLNVALVDAGLAAHESRRYYQTSHLVSPARTPFQVIEGHVMLVPGTTPIVPDFPSVAATECGAAGMVLGHFFGDGPRLFTLAGPAGHDGGDDPPTSPRSFARVADATLEGALAGFFAGREFREACTLGYDLGVRVARRVVKRSPR